MKLMRRGDTGPQVLLLQGMLRHLDFVLTVDGTFGSGTEAVVREFQTAAGLAADGIVGQDTAARLNMAIWSRARVGDDEAFDFTS